MKIDMRKKISIVFESFSGHGLPKIFSSEDIALRIFCALLYLTSFVVCSVFVTQNYLSYLDFEVVTNIEITKEEPMNFPAVTICNPNVAFYKNVSQSQLDQIHELNQRIDPELNLNKESELFLVNSLEIINKEGDKYSDWQRFYNESIWK